MTESIPQSLSPRNIRRGQRPRSPPNLGDLTRTGIRRASRVQAGRSSVDDCNVKCAPDSLKRPIRLTLSFVVHGPELTSSDVGGRLEASVWLLAKPCATPQ